MNTTSNIKDLLDLACERTTSTDPLVARRYYEDCQNHANRDSYKADVEKRALNLAKKTKKLAMICAGGFLSFGLFVVIENSTGVWASYALGLAAVSVSAILFAAIEGIRVSGQNETVYGEQMLLKPIGDEPAHCLALKEMVIRSKAVAHYVKETVERNEQLTCGDLAVAWALETGEKKQGRNLDAKAACLELHTLATIQTD